MDAIRDISKTAVTVGQAVAVLGLTAGGLMLLALLVALVV